VPLQNNADQEVFPKPVKPKCFVRVPDGATKVAPFTRSHDSTRVFPQAVKPKSIKCAA
jgi:hypothetical protein